MDFSCEDNTVRLTATDEDGNRAELVRDISYEEPRDPSMAREQVEKHLSSTGNTPFTVRRLTLSQRVGFIPVSFLNGIKRTVLEDLVKIRSEKYPRETSAFVPNNAPYPEKRLDYHANAFNEQTRRFYQRHGVEVVEPAFESLPDVCGREVMRTKYCLLHELGACLKSRHSSRRLREPLHISDAHHTYLLKFDCDSCKMSLVFLGRK
jgi:putative protease